MGVQDESRNLVRIVFFVLGFMVGIMSYKVIAFVTPVIPHAQMVYNDCPRVQGGARWCTGPGAPAP